MYTTQSKSGNRYKTTHNGGKINVGGDDDDNGLSTGEAKCIIALVTFIYVYTVCTAHLYWM